MSGLKGVDDAILPDSWQKAKIGDHFEFKNGLNKAKHFFGHGTPIINYMDVYRHPWLLPSQVSGKVYVTRTEQQAYSAKQHDAFFTRTSETVAEIGMCSVLMGPIESAVFSGFVLRARPVGDRLLPGFAAYALRSRKVREQIESSATYTTRALTNGRSLSAVNFALPPKLEQGRITAALQDIDDLVATLDTLIAKKRDIKQAAMQQLLTGKTRLPGHSAGWASARLGRKVEFSKGRGLPKSALNPGGSAPCIHYGELFTHYGPSISTITSRTFDTASAALSRANDVLMPTSDVTPRGLAKASCVLVDGVIIGGDALIIRPDPAKINGVFLAYLIRQSETAILNLVRGSTVFHIYATDLSRLELHLPEVEEQIAIAEVLTDMDTELEQLAVKRAKAASLKEGMMQQLLTGRIRLV